MLKPGDENRKRIYKYYPLEKGNKAHLEHIISLLDCGDLYFSNPSEFNDPYDSLVDFDFSNVKEKDIEVFIANEVKNGILPSINGVKFLDSKNSWAEILAQIEVKIKKIRKQIAGNTFRIACFSDDQKNILMWSHYASSHQGVCIGFETVVKANSLCIATKEFPSLDPYTIVLQPMTYDKIRPKPYNMFKDPAIEAMINFSLAKHNQWAYEKERRATIVANLFPTTGIVKVELESIKEIIFGANIDPAGLQCLQKLLEKRIPPIEMYKAEIPNNSYDLEIKKL
jgi:hypothetical protein